MFMRRVAGELTSVLWFFPLDALSFKAFEDLWSLCILTPEMFEGAKRFCETGLQSWILVQNASVSTILLVPASENVSELLVKMESLSLEWFVEIEYSHICDVKCSNCHVRKVKRNQ